MEKLKKTALFEEHKRLGGKIIEFAGWALPVQYEGIMDEHHRVRNQAGLFDVSHMGEIQIKGRDALALVQKLITNDIAKLKEGRIAYSPMCNHEGGIIDDLLVYKYGEEDYLLVVNAGNTRKDYEWILEQAQGMEVEVEDLSQGIAQLALQGPKSEEILQALTDTDLSQISPFSFHREVIIGDAQCMVSRTGYTGEDGFEIYCANGDVLKIWKDLLAVGEDAGLKPAGLGARDTLRFEAGLPLYGNEMDETISPLEAGLGFFVKLDKEDFIGKQALERQRAEGPKRKLVGFEMEKGIPRNGYPVLKDGKEIGVVTTGYLSPTLKKNIGFALIQVQYSELGQEIQVQIRKRILPAKIINKRFLK